MKRLVTSSYKTIQINHGNLTYAVDDNEVYIISYSGHDTEIIIPELIEDCPVVCIAKKAFLSNKLVKEISLPKSIYEIGDWAFARCDRLKKVSIPFKNLNLGQSIFLDCISLEQIIDARGSDSDKKTVDVSYLLAATMGILDAFYLFDLEAAGTPEWFKQWDVRMKNKMEMDDSDGFSKMLLCGEEDYGSNETDPEYYKHLKRMAKVRVAMLRLMHDYSLDREVADNLLKYLLMHIKGNKHEETWKVVLDEHGDDKAYYEFLTEIGAVNENNLQDMLSDLGDRHTEMKAFLMKYNDKLNEGKDAFSAFEL